MTRSSINLTIPGEPTGKGRPRHTKAGHTYTPKGTRSYENTVKNMFKAKYKGFEPLTGQLSAEIFAYMKIPKGKSKALTEAMRANQTRPTKKPDADNIAKIALDSLNGLAYADDKQVVDCTIHKYYSDEPRVTVIINHI